MLQGLIAAMPQDTLPSEADLRLNLPILLFTLLATTIAGLMAGSVPAWYASRVDPGEALKGGWTHGTSAGKHRLRRVLVVGEFTLALVLLAGAGLAIHSFWNLTRVDLGVKTDHVLTFFCRYRMRGRRIHSRLVPITVTYWRGSMRCREWSMRRR